MKVLGDSDVICMVVEVCLAADKDNPDIVGITVAMNVIVSYGDAVVIVLVTDIADSGVVSMVVDGW